VIVNIVAFHSFLAPSGLAIPVVVVLLEVFLARSYWSAFSGILRAHALPDPSRSVLEARARVEHDGALAR
jgi:hypothetical protein